MGKVKRELLVIDGAYGEGGGQILRTALSLSALTGRPLRIERVRAGRRNPGLAAQHLTAIRAAAAIVDARLEGDALGSATLEFQPRRPPMPGFYQFDVAEAREGGSAGAATLVLQTITLPLALAGGESTAVAKGGTHVPWSPSFDFFENVWLETLRRLGADASACLNAWGFYPAGSGEISMQLGGSASLNPMIALERGVLESITGRAVAASLPSHIAQRMADRAEALLRPLGAPTSIRTERVRSVSPGAWIFLQGDYTKTVSGFGANGRRGKPSEVVAEEAATEFREFNRRPGALDRHLADQILLPLSLAHGESEFTCEAVTRHLETNAWVIQQFDAAEISITRNRDGTGHIHARPMWKPV